MKKQSLFYYFREITINELGSFLVGELEGHARTKNEAKQIAKQLRKKIDKNSHVGIFNDNCDLVGSTKAR